jgi:hypothetical protein
MPADERFAGFPLLVVLHIVGAAAYVIVGAFQSVPRFGRRHLTWHQRAGRVLTVAGLLVAGSVVDDPALRTEAGQGSSAASHRAAEARRPSRIRP